jgi:protocatechuate 3,4-dioxygenase beta subunit
MMRHALIVTGLAIMAGLAACGPARDSARGPERAATNGPSMNTPSRPDTVSWVVTLAAPDEPGERFILQGRVLDSGRGPVGGAAMHVYHADSAGAYARRLDAPPRLAGDLRTAADGHYEVHTVLPGGYDGPPHVHVSVRPRGGGPQSFTVNIPMPVPPRTSARTGRPARIDWLAPVEVDLVRDSAGVLRLRHDFVLSR